MSENVTPPKKKHPWLWGCGIGCGAILTIAVLAGVAVFFYAQRGIQHVKELAVEQLKASYEEYRNAGKLTPEQDQVFTPLLKACGEEGASFFIPMLALSLFQENARPDGAHSVESLTVARELAAFLQSHPQAGMRDIFTFVSKYPWLNDAFTKASKDTPPFLLRPNQ